MARRSKASDEPAVNLDSLLDALTNVVAVLILVLILLQSDVAKTVERVLGNLPPATPEQIENATADLDRFTRERDAVKAALTAKPPDPQLIAQAKADLTQLEQSLKDSDVRLLAIEKLRQLQGEHQSVLTAEQNKTNALLEEIRKIDALLDQTPRPEVRKPDVVRVPNSRAIPAGAEIYYAYVIGDRVHLVDPVTARKMVLAEFAKVRAKMLRETIKVKGAKDRKIYDQDKLVKHFATLDMNVRGQKITVPGNPYWQHLFMRVAIDAQNGGVTLAEMANPKSEWHRICNLVRSFPRSVLMFRVHPNGFATYLKAREIADRFYIPCGWEITGNLTYDEDLKEFEVNRLEEPPPAPPPTGPARPMPVSGLD